MSKASPVRLHAALRGGRLHSAERFALRLSAQAALRARLPEKNVEQAWKRLAGLERQHNLLEREIHIVDLRQPDRLVLRLTEPEVERRKEERSAVKPKGARV